MFKTVKKIFSLLILITVMSCATDHDAARQMPEYGEALIAQVNDLLDSEQYSRALHLCRTIDDERISGIEKKAFTGLEADYHKAVDEQRYLDAAQYLKSLTSAGWEAEDSLPEIYMSQVMKEIDEDSVTPALALFQQKIIRQKAEIRAADDELDKLFSAAVENKNRVVLKYLLDAYPDYAAERVEVISTVTEYTPEKDEMISGTVTIWVDRGIRIERGVGYPDRIIGSGFYIDRRGYILTNYHVISSEVDTEYEGFSRLYIKYDKNEEKIPAAVVGWDESLDIALIKVAYTPEYIYSFPEIREFKPGEKIYAIGSPGGLDKTITSGIISATGDRRLLPLGDTIQVDVPINSGNSGGPVVDDEGNLVGVVFAGIEQFEGVNFIIPVKWILNSMTELYAEGRNRQSWLGFTVHESNDGLEIIYVMPGTSGFVSGVEAGDQIISIDGVEIDEITEAQEQILCSRPDTLVNLVLERSGEQLEFLLITEARDDMPMERALELDSKKNLVAPFLGMAVERGNADVAGQEYIIRKVYRGMTADETGLSVDDPFSIVNWEIDEDNDVVIAGIRIKKRKAGFLETVIHLGNYIDINNTI